MAADESKLGDCIDELVDKKKTACLNEARSYPHGNLWTSRLQLQSDCDAQLLLHVPFISTVKLSAINLVAPVGDDLSTLPTKLHVFVNKPSLDLDDVEDYFPVMEFELTPKDWAEDTVLKLKYHKFQRVTSVQLFFDTDDEDAEKSILETVSFFGKAAETMDMSQFKKVG